MHLELAQTYASGDIAVLVAIERQHGEVSGMPDQDWSLRVNTCRHHSSVLAFPQATTFRPEACKAVASCGHRG